MSRAALLSVVLAIGSAACNRSRPGAATSAPAVADETYEMHVDPNALVGWTCRIAANVRMGDRFATSPDAGSIFDFTFARIGERGELELELRRVEFGYELGGHVRRTIIDAQAITDIRGGKREVVRGEHDAEVQRRIVALTQQPHVFLLLDDHARVTGYEVNFGEEAGQIPALEMLGLAWAFGYPELPAAARVGARWQGVRPWPGPGATEVGLEYRLAAVKDGIATIDIAAPKEVDEVAQARIERSIKGRARVRIADGMFLGGEVEADLDFEADRKRVYFGFRFDTGCLPPSKQSKS